MYCTLCATSNKANWWSIYTNIALHRRNLKPSPIIDLCLSNYCSRRHTCLPAFVIDSCCYRDVFFWHNLLKFSMINWSTWIFDLHFMRAVSCEKTKIISWVILHVSKKTGCRFIFYVAVQTLFSCKPNITQSYFIALMDTKNNIYHQKLILV